MIVRRSAICALVLFASTGAGLAQNSGGDFVTEYVEDFESLDATGLLSRRDREAIHPGEPLKVVGLGQEENDFRSGLHAAAQGNFVPVAVNEEESYARQLAMFESPQLKFSQGLERSYLPRDTRGGAAPPPRLRKERGAGAGSDDEPASTAWIGMLIAAVASVGLFLTHGRSDLR